MMLAALVLAAVLPVTATPLTGLHYLVGRWDCTYRAGAQHLAYVATYTDDSNGRILREIASSTSFSDEELLTYDAHRKGWTAVVIDDQGNATVMRATGKDPTHIAYRSAYPDASVTVTFARVSATKYTLHGAVRMGSKTINSVDTCVRS